MGSVRMRTVSCWRVTFEQLLNEKVKEIKLVRQEEIDQWDRWPETSPVASTLRSVQVLERTIVVAIDMLNLKLKDGATLFRGVSDLTLSVYDIKKSGQVVFRKVLPPVVIQRWLVLRRRETRQSSAVSFDSGCSTVGSSLYPYEGVQRGCRREISGLWLRELGHCFRFDDSQHPSR